MQASDMGIGLRPSISYHPDMVYNNFLGGSMGRKVIFNHYLLTCTINMNQMCREKYEFHRSCDLVGLLRETRANDGTMTSLLISKENDCEYIENPSLPWMKFSTGMFDVFLKMFLTWCLISFKGWHLFISLFWARLVCSVKKWCLMTCSLTGSSWLNFALF